MRYVCTYLARTLLTSRLCGFKPHATRPTKSALHRETRTQHRTFPSPKTALYSTTVLVSRESFKIPNLSASSSRLPSLRPSQSPRNPSECRQPRFDCQATSVKPPWTCPSYTESLLLRCSLKKCKDLTRSSPVTPRAISRSRGIFDRHVALARNLSRRASTYQNLCVL